MVRSDIDDDGSPHEYGEDLPECHLAFVELTLRLFSQELSRYEVVKDQDEEDALHACGGKGRRGYE